MPGALQYHLYFISISTGIKLKPKEKSSDKSNIYLVSSITLNKKKWTQKEHLAGHSLISTLPHEALTCVSHNRPQEIPQEQEYHGKQ